MYRCFCFWKLVGVVGFLHSDSEYLRHLGTAASRAIATSLFLRTARAPIRTKTPPDWTATWTSYYFYYIHFGNRFSGVGLLHVYDPFCWGSQLLCIGHQSPPCTSLSSSLYIIVRQPFENLTSHTFPKSGIFVFPVVHHCLPRCTSLYAYSSRIWPHIPFPTASSLSSSRYEYVVRRWNHKSPCTTKEWALLSWRISGLVPQSRQK